MIRLPISGINNICRICLKSKSEEMFCVYDNFSQEFNEPIFCIIMYCASVIISKEDGLPDLLCSSCKLRLETAYVFKRDCEQSDAKLRMKIEVDYNYEQENYVTDNLDSTNHSNIANVKLENDTKTEVFHYGNVDSNIDDSLDPIQRKILSDDAAENQITAKEENFLKVETLLSEDNDSNSWKQSDHKTENDNTKLKKKLRKRSSVDKTKTRKICYECSKSFKTQADYEAHITQHTTQKYGCDYENCNTEFVCYLKYALHRKNDHFVKNYLTCKECQRNFSNKHSFDRHLYNQHGDLPFGCLKCSKMFPDENALENHTKIHSKQYKCEFCQKVFSTSFRLTSHTRLHTQEKPFGCTECGKSWTDKSSLNKHLNKYHKEINNGRKVKSHLCSYCGRTFDRLSHLTIHIRTHTGAKPFSCEYCDHRCRTKQHLSSHMRIHTGDRPYKCSYCEKSFADRGYLTVHERFHSGHRPYICSTCTKGFTNSKDLKVHERTHTGMKLYSCDICHNSFTTLHYFRVHTKKHNLNTNNTPT